MDVNHLKNFYELVLAGSVRRLAEMRNMPVSNISRQLANLEKEMGHPLLERRQGLSGLKLTRQGEILFKALPNVFGTFDNVRVMMEADPEVNKGEITIFTTTALIEEWLVPMLPKLNATYPNIQLNFISHDSLIPHEMKQRSISISPKDDENQDIIQTPLLEFHVGLWASPDYLDRYGRPHHLEDLVRHKLIVFARDFDQMTYPNIDWHIKSLNQTFQGRPLDMVCINSTRALIKAAYQGLGIISLSREAIRATGYTLERVLPDIDGPTVSMCLTYPKYWGGQDIIHKVRDFLMHEFKTAAKRMEDET
ncbi:MAG: LysR family transcriptional regulator [Holosporales bacterium]